MKAILMSIRPKWVEKILSGAKIIEVRKSCPKLKPPFDVYIYCTKEKNNDYLVYKPKIGGLRDFGFGFVVAKFTVKKVEDFSVYSCDTSLAKFNELCKMSCLTHDELFDYGDKGKYLLNALYISNLVIFDKPKEIGEFKKTRKSWKQEDIDYVSKAPQSWQYIEVEK